MTTATVSYLVCSDWFPVQHQSDVMEILTARALEKLHHVLL